MKLGVVGVGYVGLVSGVCLSDFGHNVVCIDKDKDKINSLRQGIMPIFEPGLDRLVEKNVASNRFIFEDNLSALSTDIEALFIAVGTPTRRGDGHADLSSLFSVLEEITKFVLPEQAIIIKSTVPVGTNEKASQYLRKKTGKDFSVISNPEFLREGSAIDDFMKPDRVVVGVRNKRDSDLMAKIYKPLYLRDFPIIYTDPESAELIKYASNAFLATKVSFINEVSALCEKVGANVKEVAKGMGLDGRIGHKFLHAGPGFGGSCFPKDTLAFTKIGRDSLAPQRIVETVVKSNLRTKKRMIERIRTILRGKLENTIICVYGVTFKPNTDDMREAPSLTILPPLIKQKAIVRVVDPKGKVEGAKLLKKVEWVSDPYEAAKGADLIVILTEWNEFRALNLNFLAKTMRNARMIDLRNIYSKKEVIEANFKEYVCVGR